MLFTAFATVLINLLKNNCVSSQWNFDFILEIGAVAYEVTLRFILSS